MLGMIGDEAFEAILAEGRNAHEEGKPMHENPYDYRWEPIQADAWDQGWKGAA